MNSGKILWDKLMLVKILALVIMGLGMGSILLALLSMWQQSNNVQKIDASAISSYQEAILFDEDVAHSITIADKNLPLYADDPEEGELMGSLTIPVLDQKMDIFQGTGVEELKKGVGHFLQSVLPGQMDNCVLSGHSDTVFKNLGELKIGDQLIMNTSAGAFTYEVGGTRIVHQDDKTVIVPTETAVLTLTTCYPFNYIGAAPQRYIVSAFLVH